MRAPFLAVALVATTLSGAQNPFATATPKYAPDRTYDLKHVKIEVHVDPARQSFRGTTTNTLAPLRDGVSILIHAGTNLDIEAVAVDGKAVTFRRADEGFVINPKTQRGQDLVVTTTYRANSTPDGGLMAYGGWHWLKPTAERPDYTGFWTQGETELNRQWAPTWDYPNDMATSETITTVPADWMVISNGDLVSDRVSGNQRTVHWRMNQPHVTYLISLVGGPFDIERDTWRGKELWYVVPRGYKHLIHDSFSDTKDMLDFFSRVLKVEYPWTKYAQNAVWEFGGGMENVSSTTLGAEMLTDRREGFMNMSSLNAHELAHQWFGDLVTCKDWGHIWLNESFATFFEMAYFEHARGPNSYNSELVNAMTSYFDEAKRYRRPLATNRYPEGDAMFDSHAYPKGAVIVHTMRRLLGDDAFYQGLNYFLTKHRHEPVETSQLCRAMTEGTGINLEPFFDQWVYRPGHPVIDYDWKAEGNQIVVTVRQLQDTSDGTPIYDIPAKIGVIAGGKLTRHEVHLNAKESTFRVPGSHADAVLFDPDMDFLRELRRSHPASELAAIAEFGATAFDRQAALQRMVVTKMPGAIELAVRLLDADMGLHPVFTSAHMLTVNPNESLRSFYRRQLTHPNIERRASAARGLVALGPNPEDATRLRDLVNEREAYAVLNAVIPSLDPTDDLSLLLRAAQIASKDAIVPGMALDVLSRSKDPRAVTAVLNAADSRDYRTRIAGLRHLGRLGATEATQKRLRAALSSKDLGILDAALQSVEANRDKMLLDALRKIEFSGDSDWMKARLDRLIKMLSES